MTRLLSGLIRDADVAACRQLPVEFDPGPLGAGDGDAVELDLAGGLLGDAVDHALAVGADLEGLDADAAGQGVRQADRRAAGDANAPELPGVVDLGVVEIDDELAVGAQLWTAATSLNGRPWLRRCEAAVAGGGGGGESRQEREGGDGGRRRPAPAEQRGCDLDRW